jgi:predicted alpha/beta superfamily hydrolase
MTVSTMVFLLTFCTTLSFSQPDSLNKAVPSKPFVLGVIEELHSAQLAESRILNIYLPEGYRADDTTTYPVIYLLDGSADEDFIHVVGLVQYNSFPWINRLPRSIVVGIATVDRRRDFTFPTTIEEDKKKFPTTGKSAKFIAFIENELQPFVQRKYKANQSRTLIGQSLGGLLATEILLKKPTLFNRYIIISPSLWWDNGSLLAQPSGIVKEGFVQKTDIYIGVGKEGPAPTKVPRVMEDDARSLVEKLKAAKNANVKVYFDYLPQEDHATIAHQAVLNAFRLLHLPTEERK